ncbi:hypothetical protein TNCV_2876371 [Trichonephila clavipes]|nr:hypothetical protein TNCV_2876371 [Trichonephila clavipes]
MITKDTCILAENIIAPSSRGPVGELLRYGFEMLLNPPYSFDLVPDDSFIFPELKNTHTFWGRKFDDTNDAIQWWNNSFQRNLLSSSMTVFERREKDE